ncbi:MAG: hypothetical protein NZM07_03085, partial [Elioraea sp.]|nr:hypothetical protein [Elioraea sp.]
MSLPAAAADWYDEAWRDFAASYNDVLGQRLRSLEAQAVTSNPATVWGLLVSGAPTLRQHLEQTARFVVRAAVIGDTHGGGRVLDLLFGAPEAISLCLTTGSGVRLVDYPDGDMVVSPALMWETDWTKVADVTKPLLPDLGRPVAAKRVFEGVLLNEWRDICLALAVVLGEFALQAGPKSVAAALLGKLLRGEFSDRHSRPAADNPEFRLLLPSPATVLRTAAVVLANDAKRGKLIEEHIRTMREIARPLPVIGQVYVEVASASNELQERSVDVALVLLALALERTLSSLWPTEPSEIGLKAPSEADERIAGFLDAVAKAASEVEDALLHPLAPTHLDPPAIREARQRVRDTCRCLARRLRRRHEQAERTAALDPERLEAIATLAGSLAFDKKKAGPPVSLFARIDLDDAEHE